MQIALFHPVRLAFALFCAPMVVFSAYIVSLVVPEVVSAVVSEVVPAVVQSVSSSLN
jgi:hypothetical protein